MERFTQIAENVYLLKVPFGPVWTGVVLLRGEKNILIDSSATGASKLLNMHRNNIVYHISKIEELLGLDLRDLRVRQNLSLAFLSTELKAAMDAGLLS